MKAVPFIGANLRLTAPKDWNEAEHGPCLTIWAHKGSGQVTTVWEPTPEERELIAKGANVAMVVAGSTIMPAVMLVVDLPAVPESLLA